MTQNHQQDGLQNLPEKGTEIIHSDDQHWQSAGDGFWYKPLLQDENHQLRSLLMKIDAGAFTESHSHDDIEQIYVVRGTFHDAENNYKAGDYIVRAAGAAHTAGSKDGCIVVLFYSPAVGMTQ